MNFGLIIFLIAAIITIIRVAKRGYFWKDKKGNELTFKQFKTSWKKGIVEATPLQQTRITLFSFMPLFAGLLWGIVVTFLGKTYWMTLILCGSLPITSIQFISNIQKYKAQKKVEELMKELNKPKRRKK